MIVDANCGVANGGTRDPATTGSSTSSTMAALEAWQAIWQCPGVQVCAVPQGEQASGEAHALVAAFAPCVSECTIAAGTGGAAKLSVSRAAMARRTKRIVTMASGEGPTTARSLHR